MESILTAWLKHRKTSMVVRRVTARGMMTVDYIAFRDKMGRNWTLGVVYSKTEIIGGIESWGNPRLEGDVAGESEYASQPFTVLDSLVREVSWEEMQSYDPQVPDDRQMREWAEHMYSQKMNDVLGVEVGNFKVSNVNRFDGYLLVHYSWRGQPQYPLQVYLQSKSVVPLRKYGDETTDYKLFASKAASAVGEFVWGVK